MNLTYQVKHEEYATSRSFDDVIAAFETVVGDIEEIGWTSIATRSATQHGWSMIVR